MSKNRVSRRKLLQVSAAAAVAASVASETSAQSSKKVGVLGYSLPPEPLSIADAERFLALGEYDYSWNGSKTDAFPNGTSETGEVVVSPRDEGPGITYVIDGDLVFQDETGAQQTRADRTTVAQIFPTIEDHIGVVIHSSFGVTFVGHVVELSEERMVLQIVGMSESVSGPTFGRFEFSKNAEGYSILSRARQDVEADWTVVSNSTWVKKA